MNRVLNFFNEFPLIELDKFNLRKIRISDFREIYDIYSCEETVKFEGMRILKDEKEAKEFIENILNGYENKYFIRWGLTKKDIDEIIGLVALHHIDYKNYTAQIGYILNRKYWGNNIATEVLFNVIKFIFDKTEIHRLEVSIHPNNNASIRVAEKIGFVREGLKIDGAFNVTDGRFEDRIVMGLIDNGGLL